MTDLPKSSLLQRTADIGCMTIEKFKNLRGKIALLQYRFADESGELQKRLGPSDRANFSQLSDD